MYSAGPARWIPGMDRFIYWLFRRWLYSRVDAIHVPTNLGKQLLLDHGYAKPIFVISNGYAPRFIPKEQRKGDAAPQIPVRIICPN